MLNVKEIVMVSFLLSVGFIIHTSIPGIIFGIKPDFLVIIMFVGIVYCKNKESIILLISGTSLVSSFTTVFPGGQIPNIIDKTITSLFFILFIILLKKHYNSLFLYIIIAVGTLVSGLTFLLSAQFLFGLPNSFLTLFLAVVLPTAIINTFIIIIIKPTVTSLYRKIKT